MQLTRESGLDQLLWQFSLADTATSDSEWLQPLGGHMTDCELTTKCLFFNDKMANMPSTANMMKRKYCQGNFEHCARYIVCKALGREKVPADLTPSQADRAKQLVR